MKNNYAEQIADLLWEGMSYEHTGNMNDEMIEEIVEVAGELSNKLKRYRDHLKNQESLPLPISNSEIDDLRIIADHIADEVSMFSTPVKIKREYNYLNEQEIEGLKNKKFGDYKLWRQNGVL